MSVTVVRGPMFAGKTSLLLAKTRRWSKEGKQVLLLSSGLDTRSGCEVVTHDGERQKAVKVNDLREVAKTLTGAEHIAVDEAQFMKGCAEFAEVAAGLGCHVVLAGLNCDFKGNAFAELANVVADRHVHLSGVCWRCGGSAVFTERLSASKDVVEIGGKSKYQPVCRACHPYLGATKGPCPAGESLDGV